MEIIISAIVLVGIGYVVYKNITAAKKSDSSDGSSGASGSRPSEGSKINLK